MKLAFAIVALLSSSTIVLSQESNPAKTLESKPNYEMKIVDPANSGKNRFSFSPKFEEVEVRRAGRSFDSNYSAHHVEKSLNKDIEYKHPLVTTSLQVPAKDPEKLYRETSSFDPATVKEKFHWKPAMAESFYFLAIQHSFRMLQTKTTDELNGPFFRDWANSVKNLGGWRDGDSFMTNYLAHPMQGAVTGRIFINNSDKGKKLEFGNSREYWESRLKAMAWSAVWSIQFELGPISEASLGNVGKYDRVGPNRMGWVDILVTPIAGTAAIIGEDFIDKYIVKRWLEKKLKSQARINLYRTLLTPFLSFTNVLGGRLPWRRYNR